MACTSEVCIADMVSDPCGDCYWANTPVHFLLACSAGGRKGAGMGKVLSIKLIQGFMLAQELTQAKEKAEELALVDDLSGLDNRCAFYLQSRIHLHCLYRRQSRGHNMASTRP